MDNDDDNDDDDDDDDCGVEEDKSWFEYIPGSAVDGLYLYVASERKRVRDAVAGKAHTGISQELNAQKITDGMVFFVEDEHPLLNEMVGRNR